MLRIFINAILLSSSLKSQVVTLKKETSVDEEYNFFFGYKKIIFILSIS